MQRARLSPEQEGRYLELVSLRTRLVKYYVVLALQRGGSGEQQQHACEQLFQASHYLVIVCQNFATKQPSSETDQFRAKARGVRMVVKQLIHHLLTPNECPVSQSDLLAEVSMDLSTYIIFLLQESRAQLTALHSGHITNGKARKKDPESRTFEEMIQIVLVRAKAFISAVQKTSGLVQGVALRKQRFLGLHSTHFLTLGQDEELVHHLKFKQDSKNALEQCDELCLLASDLTSSVRTFFDLADDLDEKQNLLGLASSVRSSSALLACELVSPFLLKRRPRSPKVRERFYWRKMTLLQSC